LQLAFLKLTVLGAYFIVLGHVVNLTFCQTLKLT
jgi:hypothetical protein